MTTDIPAQKSRSSCLLRFQSHENPLHEGSCEKIDNRAFSREKRAQERSTRWNARSARVFGCSPEAGASENRSIQFFPSSKSSAKQRQLQHPRGEWDSTPAEFPTSPRRGSSHRTLRRNTASETLGQGWREAPG